jgi:OFA family oxalate/formate antiporter-like MFS transporter
MVPEGTFTGISVGTFAAGSIIFKQVITYFLGSGPYTPESLRGTFISLALVYLIMGGIGALLIDNPEGYSANKKQNTGDFRPSKMIQTRNFAILFIAFLFTTMPGILTIGLAKDIATDLVGLDLTTAANIVAWVAVFNASGRMLSGMAADKIGALNVIKITTVISVIALGMFTFLELNNFTFIVAILGVVAGYGSFLAIFPSLVNQLFGESYYAANYGIVYQGYGLAALVGPLVLGFSSGMTQTFLISMIIAILGVVTINLVKPQPKYEEPLATNIKKTA